MKTPVITLWQPWAGFLADGTKTHETRSWAPPAKLLGQRIAIHAAARKPDRTAVPKGLPLIYLDRDFKTGVVLSTAILTEFFEMSDENPTAGAANEIDIALGIWTPGRFAWRFEGHQLFDNPIPMRGFQRIWYCDL